MKLILKATIQDLESLTKGKEGSIGALDVRVWRSGPIKDGGRGIFFAGDRAGAAAYSELHGAEPLEYLVKAKNVFVTSNHASLCRILLGKSFQDEVVRVDLASGGKSSREAARKVEARLARELRKLKYDALVYTNPPAPAKIELAVIDLKSTTVQPQ